MIHVMDPAPVSTPSSAPAPAPLARRSKTDRILYVALGTGFIAALVIGACWYIQQGERIFSNKDFMLTSDGSPLLSAMAIDVKSKTLSPITVSGLGEAVVVDYAKGDDTDYYLISGDSLQTSNLYASNQAGKGAGLQQITASPTVKYALSFDAQSNIAAYEVLQEDESSVITVWQLGTTTEQALIAGNNPVVLEGGQYLTYDDGEKLYSIQIGTGESKELLTLPKYASYAVDAKKKEVLIFDPLRKEYQYFSLVNSTAASYVRMESSESGSQGRLLSLSKGKRIEARLSENGLVLVVGESEPITIAGSLPYRDGRITNLHD